MFGQVTRTSACWMHEARHPRSDPERNLIVGLGMYRVPSRGAAALDREALTDVLNSPPPQPPLGKAVPQEKGR